jgi:outer membrane protein
MDATTRMAAVAATVLTIAAAPVTAQQQDTLAMRLSEAVSISLASNLQLQSAQLDTQIQRAGLAAEEARFGRTLSGSFAHQSEVSPSISALEAVQNATTNVQSIAAGVSQELTSGGRIGLELRNTRSSSNAVYYTIDPVYRSALELTLSQPLLRGRGQVNLSGRDQARNDLAATRLELQGRIRALRAEAALAYWRLFAAQNHMEVAQQLRDGAARVLETVRSRAQMGAAKRSSILEAEVGVAQREEEIVVADGAVRSAQDRLKALCGLDRDPATLAMEVALLDTPNVTPFTGDLAAGIERGLELSTAYQRARLRLENLDLQIAVARDRTRPQVDLSARAGLTGIGADYSADMEGLAKADGRSWGGTVSLSVPLGQDTQKAQYRRSQLQKQRDQVDLQDLRLQIIQQARGQLREVQIGARRTEAARAAVRLARQNVQEQEARLSLGLSTVRQVLDAQDDLASARSRLLQAVVDYSSAVIRWEELTGA